MLHETCKQEFNDWPQALLVIGTLGNDNLKGDLDHHSSNTSTSQDSSQDDDCVQEFITLDAAGNHDQNNELNIYFREQLVVESNGVITEQKEDNIDKKQRLNSQHSSLQVEGKETETFSDGDNSSKAGNFYPNSSVIRCLDKSASVNGRKSLVFLLKKMFVCRSGFPPTAPSFSDLLSTQSTMEKILRARLHKKLYRHGSSSSIPMKKCLENKHAPKSDNGEDDLTSDADSGSKWDNTDSEYIVLEI
ncbi:protein NEGATIVE GRAVITROPIC RESPONSE OF ROOTS-like [Lotus japonicus]|uniref:protein NEGATIVE GRAVITROPIC RESPONSE OF ROOTS-like n=1 Tax=Lotus japonicus TaxID=34305 RepID=UPI00258C3F05|nr:protein NEGATIVE GRAVITROPIC RESPONSE OF ROOTS-like [Lotus japonicus]